MTPRAPIVDPGAIVAVDFFASVAAFLAGSFFYSFVDMTGLLSRVGVVIVSLLGHIGVRAEVRTRGARVPAAASTMNPADIRR